MSEAIRIENLHKSFGATKVLQGVDLTVEDHDVVCLIGASGSCKSTLLRIRQGIGIVFQSFNLFPHMTVLDNVVLAPTRVLQLSRSDARDRAMELLARFGLAARSGDYPDRLSGGQQQRVAIVRALAMDPDVLLLDEVTSALDPVLVAEVLDAIRELAARGMTMLIATHEMGFARDVAQRVAFLHDGMILEQDAPERIFSEPSEPETRRFLERIVAAGRM